MSVTLAQNEGDAVTGVPLLDLKAQYRGLRDEIEEAIREVCESQYFVMGPKVKELEQRIAEYSHSDFGIGVSSGTDALLAALMALDVGPGDEVITTPFSFFATAGVIARLGARPVFCDIDPETYNLDAEAVRSFIGNNCRMQGNQLVNSETGGRVRVVMPVHLFGQLADMQAIMDIASEFGLFVIEDAAQAIGAEDVDGRRAGSIGHIGCFSFFPSKNLGAFGDGGMCVTSDAALAEKLGILRLHGGKPKYYHSIIGGNFRLDALQAAVLLVKLEHLDAWTEGRQRNADAYDRLLEEVSAEVVRPHRRPGARHIFNQYTVRVADRDGLREELGNHNIGAEVYYPVPLHLQKCFDELGHKPGDFPVAESASDSVLSVPIYPELSQEQLEYVSAAIRGYVSSSTG